MGVEKRVLWFKFTTQVDPAEYIVTDAEINLENPGEINSTNRSDWLINGEASADPLVDIGNLVNIEFGSNVTTIEQGAFEAVAGNLRSVIISNTVTEIKNYAFYACADLNSVTINDGGNELSIGRGVFTQCSSLTSIDIPNSVTSIGPYAFYKCYQLSQVTLPTNSTLLY